MVSMIEKKYINQDMNIELTSYIDNKQNVWFRGKDVAEILGYSDTKQAIKKHVADKYKMLFPYRPGGLETTPQVRWYTFINEAGFYALIFGSKKEFALKF